MDTDEQKRETDTIPIPVNRKSNRYDINKQETIDVIPINKKQKMRYR